jgi:hypothetical protein
VIAMTVVVTHRSRTVAPHAFAMPIVREVPATPPSAGAKSAW